MSTRWGFDKEDVKSVVRHTIIPLIAGAALTAFDAYTAGGITLVTASKGVVVAVGSGLLRAVVRWATITKG